MGELGAKIIDYLQAQSEICDEWVTAQWIDNKLNITLKISSQEYYNLLCNMVEKGFIIQDHHGYKIKKVSLPPESGKG